MTSATALAYARHIMNKKQRKEHRQKIAVAVTNDPGGYEEFFRDISASTKSVGPVVIGGLWCAGIRNRQSLRNMTELEMLRIPELGHKRMAQLKKL